MNFNPADIPFTTHQSTNLPIYQFPNLLIIMLKQVLHEIETANGPIHLGELSRKMGVERSALNGMIQFWVQKGRLLDDAPTGHSDSTLCGGSCRGSCSGPDSCSFVMKMPQTFSIRSQE